MRKPDLRFCMALGAGSALVLSLAGHSAAEADVQLALPFAPPQSELILTRTLRRPLHDGKEVVTRRSYKVRISRVADGYRVDGTLVDTAVEAPELLKALAEIERNRPDIGLFPIELDAQGMIVGSSSVQADGSLDRAAQIAAGQIGASGLPALDMLQAQSFIQQMRSRSARSQWPSDVFHPLVRNRTETRMIALPGGDEGKVLIEIATHRGGARGLIAMLSRTVTTELAGSKRMTREEWQLSRQDRDPSR